jgi:hypothetical protein
MAPSNVVAPDLAGIAEQSWFGVLQPPGEQIAALQSPSR